MPQFNHLFEGTIEILEYLQQNKSEFHSRYGVTKIGLFGSYARDQNNEESDIDIVVEFLKEKKNRLENSYKRQRGLIWSRRTVATGRDVIDKDERRR